MATRWERQRAEFERARAQGLTSAPNPTAYRAEKGLRLGRTRAQAIGKRSAGLSASDLVKMPPKRLATEAPEAFQVRTRAINAVSDMRGGMTLGDAARLHDVPPEAVRLWAADALERGPSGEWTARRSDRLGRYILVATGGAVVPVMVRSSAQASLVGRHWNAISAFLNGDDHALDPFRGRKVSGMELEADPDTILTMSNNDQLGLSHGDEGTTIYVTAA